jgi:hypothetical protein
VDAPPPSGLNPYAPPAASLIAPLGPAALADGPRELYRPLGTLAGALTFVLGGIALTGLLSIGNAQRVATAMDRVQAGIEVPQADLEGMDAMTQLLAVGMLGLVIVAAVLMCFFMPRANRNARSWGITTLEFSPRWAAGVFFVPIWCLWKPYRAMKELWGAGETDPRVPPQYAPEPTLYPWWWGLFIADGVVNNISGRIASNLGPSGLSAAMHFDQLASALTIASSILAILVVRGLAKRHEAREALARQQG